MFTKYPQSEIEKHWDVFKGYLKENLPPTSNGLDVNLDEVYVKLLSDEMHLWIFVNDTQDVKGFLITSFSQELGFSFRNLVIYAAVATTAISDTEWKEALVLVKDFAKKFECKRILAYSSNPRVIEIVNMLGGDTSFHLVTLEV